MKTLVERLLRHAGPNAVLPLGEFEAAPLDSAQAYAHGLGIGRFDTRNVAKRWEFTCGNSWPG